MSVAQFRPLIIDPEELEKWMPKECDEAKALLLQALTLIGLAISLLSAE